MLIHSVVIDVEIELFGAGAVLAAKRRISPWTMPKGNWNNCWLADEPMKKYTRGISSFIVLLFVYIRTEKWGTNISLKNGTLPWNLLFLAAMF